MKEDFHPEKPEEIVSPFDLCGEERKSRISSVIETTMGGLSLFAHLIHRMPGDKELSKRNPTLKADDHTWAESTVSWTSVDHESIMSVVLL